MLLLSHSGKSLGGKKIKKKGICGCIWVNILIFRLIISPTFSCQDRTKYKCKVIEKQGYTSLCRTDHIFSLSLSLSPSFALIKTLQLYGMDVVIFLSYSTQRQVLQYLLFVIILGVAALFATFYRIFYLISLFLSFSHSRFFSSILSPRIIVMFLLQ